MSIFNSDYALSGVSNDEFDVVALRLLDMSSRFMIIELNVWGKEGQHHCAKFGEGTDLRDALGILELSPQHASRLSCLIALRLGSVSTNVIVTLARRSGWTLVDGQLFLAPFATAFESHVGLENLMIELARIAEALDLLILNLADEDVSHVIPGTELLEPAVAAIFDPTALPAMGRSDIDIGKRRVLWFIEPSAFIRGETKVNEEQGRFVACCGETWSALFSEARVSAALK